MAAVRGGFVSNNNPDNTRTKEICRNYPFVQYYENEKDLGIDKNHEMVYKYCQSGYVLLLADDDILLPGSFKVINEFVSNYDFLFAICNSGEVINDKLNKKPCYDIDSDMVMDTFDAMDFFIYEKPLKVFPMLQYFGGIIINLNSMRLLSKPNERDLFSGTYHQYIGGLWNALLENCLQRDLKVGLIKDVCVAIGCDSDKTWYPYIQAVIDKMNSFYDNLEIDELRRKHISFLVKYSGRYTHYFYPLAKMIAKKQKRYGKVENEKKENNGCVRNTSRSH